MVNWTLYTIFITTGLLCFYITAISAYAAYNTTVNSIQSETLKISTEDSISLNSTQNLPALNSSENTAPLNFTEYQPQFLNATLRKSRQNVLFVSDLRTESLTINKCCEPNQMLNFKHQCEAQESREFDPNDIIGKLEFFVIDENMQKSYINVSRIQLNYNYLTPAVADDGIVAQFPINEDNPNIINIPYRFSQEDGSLLELNKNFTKVDKRFSVGTYCLDDNSYIGSGLIAFISPCVENLCIRKCCPKDWYFKTGTRECETGSANEFKPNFYFVTSPSEKNISYYLLHGQPKCTNFEYPAKIKTSNFSEPIYIQEDGYMIVVDKTNKNYYYYDNKSYCVDYFTIGNNQVIVNGLYCAKEHAFIRPADVDLRAMSVDSPTSQKSAEIKSPKPSTSLPIHNNSSQSKRKLYVGNIGHSERKPISEPHSCQNTIQSHRIFVGIFSILILIFMSMQ